MKNMRIALCLLLGLLGVILTGSLQAQEGHVHLDKVHCSLCDKGSLQRGAKLYVNYCSGCHSLQYVRFKDMARGIGVVDKEGKVLDSLVNSNFNFISDNVYHPIQNAMPKKDGQKWFGVAPPDLTLVTRTRGKDWVFTYLKSFYTDNKKPWGVNNTLFPDVAMPNILQSLQGDQEPVYKTEILLDEHGKSYEKQVIDHLRLKSSGTLTPQEFDATITDLVNFLDYVGEPHKLERRKLGVWVLLFCVVFTLFAYLLKREFWKDVH